MPGWNGIAMRYGDGSGNPLISIDVVGHELAHGVTGYSAGLIYANESGALNESFSDIFGTAVEFHAMSDSADWAIGKLDFHLRQMDDPNSFNDPHTYFGSFWYTGTADNGGVHINSGVQNYWFYLLSEGGSGTNDLGNNYQVDSFGIDNAAEIAYRNLVYYLTPSSDYYDARRGSISAAEDLYGSCSYETNLIAKAWHAVGVGSDTLSNDIEIISAISPMNSCELGAQETMSLKYAYFRSGCDSIIAAGDSIKFGYAVNGGTPVVETLIVNSTVNNGDTLTYQFTTKADFINPGSYSVKFWTAYDGDYMQENDSLDYDLKVLEPTQEDDSITFEPALATIEEPIYNLITGDNGSTNLSVRARNTGLLGLQLSAEESQLSNLDIPSGESENFEKNPQNSSKICMCVDATNMSHITLQFDLKQTYSAAYQFFMGPGANLIASSLRITIDSAQVGPQFHPVTYTQDPYKTHFFNLDQFAGTQFELCLEGKHFISLYDDPGGTQGDNSFVDNIKITDAEFIGEEEFELSQVAVFPNPTKGILNINMNASKNGFTTLKIMDTKGAVVIQKSLDTESGTQSFSVDISSQPKGMYLLQIQQGNALYSQKVMLD